MSSYVLRKSRSFSSRKISHPLVAFLILLVCSPAFAQEKTRECQPAIVNKSCVVTIDRESPVTPRPITVERGAEVTLEVLIRPSEAAEMEAKYKDSDPPDPFETLFSKALPELEAVTLGIVTTPPAPPPTPQETTAVDLPFREIPFIPPVGPVIDKFKRIQSELDKEHKSLRSIKDKIDGIQTDFDRLKTAPWRDLESGQPEKLEVSMAAEHLLNVLGDPETACEVKEAPLCQLPSLQAISTMFDETLKAFDELDPDEVNTYYSSQRSSEQESSNSNEGSSNTGSTDSNPSPNDEYSKTQVKINSIASNLAIVETALNDVTEAQQTLSKAVPIIQDICHSPHFSDTKQYSIRTSPGVGQIADINVSVKNRFSEKTTSLGTVEIQWAGTRWEVSGGLLFSALPQRSFAITPQINSANVATNVVTETIARPSFVAPAMLGHFRLFEAVAGGRRHAILATGAIGLNTSTKLADFGVGLSYSYRGFVISPLLLFTRDRSLTNGFYVGQTAPDGVDSVSSGLHWVRKFAIGISYRIPVK